MQTAKYRNTASGWRITFRERPSPNLAPALTVVTHHRNARPKGTLAELPADRDHARSVCIVSSSHGGDGRQDRWPPDNTDERGLPQQPPADLTDKAEMLARLARLVAAGDRRHSLPERLADACRRLLRVDGTAITLHNTTLQRITLWTTDPAAARLEDLQEVTGEGPSHEAFTTGEPVITRLDENERRWAEFTDAARRSIGVLTIHALPIRSQVEVIGVLSLHQFDPVATVPPLDGAQFLADAIGAALIADAPTPDYIEDAGPWSNRAEIHQATGMVIAQLRVPASDALAILRAHAFAHDATLQDIAAQVIAGRLDFGSDSSESL